MPPVNTYRILVVDDDKVMCEVATEEIIEICGSENVYVDSAYIPQDAVNLVRAHRYDLIILDLYRYRELVGFEVYRHLSELGCSAEVILMTRFDLDPAVKTLLRLLASQTSLVLVGFSDKRDPYSLREHVSKRYERFAAMRLEAVNLSMVSSLIDRRRDHYERPGLFPLREGLAEIDAEIYRLLCGLYVEFPMSLERATNVSVSLDQIDRVGLGAAVVVTATVRVALEGAAEVHAGHRTILKVGPKPDILEEASRFQEFVRYGAELEQRVELLGVAAKDSLGALTYCFPGNLYRNKISSLDQRLVDDMLRENMKSSRAILAGLFAPRNWYSIRVDDMDPGRYFSQNFRTDLLRSYQVGESELRELARVLGDKVKFAVVSQASKEEYLEVSIGSAKALILPTSSVLGRGSILRAVPACLVHGKMHAGNVMIEVLDSESPNKEVSSDSDLGLGKVCLIDFRNAGPGPRTIDAIALESSIRLLDSMATCRKLFDSGESGLSDINRSAIAEMMADRFDDELSLYQAVFEGLGEIPTAGWCLAAGEVLEALRFCFPNITLEEYLTNSIRYAMWQLGHKMPPVARVRLLAWLAAQYHLLP